MSQDVLFDEYERRFGHLRKSRVADKKERLVKINNKFYVAAERVTTAKEQALNPIAYKQWPKKTLAEAIKHAEEILNESSLKDHVAIVKIIRVVRRKEVPIVVETVK